MHQPTLRPSSATTTDAKIAGTQLAIGLTFLASFLYLCIRARFTVPYRDDWDWLSWLFTRPLTLKTLFEPHNEHMIPLPRLLVALQYRLEGSGTHLVFAVAVASQLALGWMFLREIWRRWPDDRSTSRFALGAAAACLFFAHQLQSFVFMAAVLFPLVQSFAVLAIVCTLTATESGGQRRFSFVAAGLAAAAAGLTTTNGLVVPLILALVLWTRRGSRTSIFVLTAIALMALAAYVLLVGRPLMKATAPAGTSWSVPPLGEMVAFFLTFFGSALAYGSTSAAMLLGTTLFAAGCHALWSTTRRRESALRIEIFAVSVMLFATASAAMATPARAQFGVLQAAQSRYASYAMAYYAALLVWTLSRVTPSEWWSRARTPLTLAATLLTAAVLVGHLFIGTVWIAKADNIAFARLALVARVNDDAWISTLHPLTWIVYETAERLRAERDPLVVDRRMGAAWAAPTTVGTCEGALALESLGSRRGARLTGSLATRAASGVVVDRSGVVRGVAGPAPLVETPNPNEPQVVDAVRQSIGRPAPAAPPWLGFAQSGDGAPYTFYALSSDETPVCRADVPAHPDRLQMYLDGPLGEVNASVSVRGWAFQCDGAVAQLRVFVDDVEQPSVVIERGLSRPDVTAAFVRRCDVDVRSGFSFQLNTSQLQPGPHRVKVAADDSVGRTFESNTTEIVVR